jgi:uncharacterized protein YdhG (YjbR/CyaY superfamily)
MQAAKFNTVEEYLSSMPKSTREILEGLRNVIKKTAPQAEEGISYNMPAFKYHGALVFYAGYENHIGFYPTASPIVAFKKELAQYKTSKGAIQFPIGKAIPTTLVKSIVKYKLKENQEKASIKSKKKK